MDPWWWAEIRSKVSHAAFAELDLAILRLHCKPAEVLYGFAGWLTSREDVAGPFSSKHEASAMAELVAAFIESQELASPREDFHRHLRPYPAGPKQSQEEP